MPSFAALGKFFGRTASEGAAFAAGVAVAPALSPVVREIVNLANQKYQSHPLSPDHAAAIVAENVELLTWGVTESSFNGVNEERFHALLGETLKAPGVGELLTLLRRDSEVNIDFSHGLRKGKLETQWDAALENLRYVRIPGPDLAFMVVRGVVPDAGTLASSLPTSADKLKLPPQLALDTLAEASKTGWDPQRFGALVARSGLAMAPVMAANAYFRGHLTLNDYLLTIARGDLFPAFAEPVLETAREILTAHDYTELELRGYYKRDQRLLNTAKHGMSEQDSDWLLDVIGRGLSLRAALIAEARGGVFKGPTDQIPEWALWQLERGNLKPEVYNLAWAARYTYPSAFVIRALLKDGAYTAAQGEADLLAIGWEPTRAKLVADHYGAGGAGHTAPKADTHLRSAVTSAVTAIRKAYVAGQITPAEADAYLHTAETATNITAVWDVIRAVESLPPPTPPPVIP